MYIDTLISHLTRSFVAGMNSFDLKLMLSLDDQLKFGNYLTEKQGKLAVSLLKKYKIKLTQALLIDISPFLENPQFKYPFRVINLSQSIKIISDPTHIKLIKVEFPYDEKIVTKFRQEKPKFFHCQWNDSERAWLFSLEEASVQFLMLLLPEYNFTCDDEFVKYMNQIQSIQKNIEHHVPMITKNEENFNFINVVEHFPKITSSDLVESLFMARKLGIYTWDEAIDKEINSDNIDPEVRTFLKTNPSDAFSLILTEKPINSLKNIVKHLLPCLVVISNGSELTKLQNTIDFFHELNIDNSEMSVLFRLPTDGGKDFNEYVRDNKLNSSVTEKTKIIFISEHIPKTILEPKKIFNSVLNYNFYTAHYKMKEFLRFQPNVINILETHNRKLNFGNM
jgi:hypothetical protein